MAALSEEIDFYEDRKAQLEADHFGKWVLVHDRTIEGFFGSFDEAARDAVGRFGRGPYLIRQIGAPTGPLPAALFCPKPYVSRPLRY
ncbi:MAG TPA: hypothetical protein VGG92_03925 [Caulobacteraceae bacterium]|jgi:hypothetical protein